MSDFLIALLFSIYFVTSILTSSQGATWLKVLEQFTVLVLVMVFGLGTKYFESFMESTMGLMLLLILVPLVSLIVLPAKWSRHWVRILRTQAAIEGKQ